MGRAGAGVVAFVATFALVWLGLRLLRDAGSPDPAPAAGSAAAEDAETESSPPRRGAQPAPHGSGRVPAVPQIPPDAADAESGPSGRPGAIQGAVRDGSGEPLTDVQVELRPAAGRTTVFPDGTFRIEDVPPGQYGVAARALDRIEALSGPVEVRSGRTETAEIMLARGYALAGRVTDLDTGFGIAGASVLLQGFGEAFTDPEGSFRFGSAQPLDALRSVVVSHPDYDRQELLHHREPDLSRLKFVLSRGPVTIHGRVVDRRGGAVPSARVRLLQTPFLHLRRTMMADAGGTFVLRGTFPMSARVEVTFPRGESCGRVVDLRLPDEGVTDVVVEIGGGRTLAGTARRRSGDTAGRDCDLILPDATVLWSGRLDAASRFRIPDIPAGTFILRFSPRSLPVTSDPVEISGDGDLVLDFDLDRGLFVR